MAEIKLTKNELRNQQRHLGQLQKYLPTLQLKKAMLQGEVLQARLEIESSQKAHDQALGVVKGFAPLLSTRLPVDPQDGVKVEKVIKGYENIAGVEVPFFEAVEFVPFSYSLFDTPPWFDSVVRKLQLLMQAKIKVEIAEEKKRALEEELRQVSIRVNLFEKILIPRAMKNIKKIKVFLGDQELAAVSRSKMAKMIIERSR